MTQVVVVVTSDFESPGQLARLRIVVEGSDRDEAKNELDLAALPLPQSFGLAPRPSSPNASVDLRIDGLDPAGQLIVQARARVAFIEGKRLRLPIFLARACAGRLCDVGQSTCSGGSCVSSIVDPNTLTEISPGQEFLMDAGIRDASQVDTGVTPDGSSPDGSAPDGSSPDATAPDADTTDAGFQDAAATDATFDDAAIADGGDAGADASVDGGCNTPGLINRPFRTVTVNFQHEIDRPLLVADLDGDGFDEIAAASAQDSVIGVMRAGCTAWDVAHRTNVTIGEDGLALSYHGGGPVLVTSGAGTIRAWRYTSEPGTLAPVGVDNTITDARFISGHPDGRTTVSSGESAGGNGLLGALDFSTGMPIERAGGGSVSWRPAYTGGSDVSDISFFAFDLERPILVDFATGDTQFQDGSADPTTDRVVLVRGGAAGDPVAV